MDHEIRDNAMKSGLLVVHLFPGHGANSLLTGAQTTEVLSGSRGNAIVQFEYHPSRCCEHEDVQVFTRTGLYNRSSPRRYTIVHTHTRVCMQERAFGAAYFYVEVCMHSHCFGLA